MFNSQQEAVFRVLLPASEIPDGATVTKRTGEVATILRHSLTVYPAPKTDAEKMEIAGTFLIGDRGSINQIAPTTQLLWSASADELSRHLRIGWEDE